MKYGKAKKPEGMSKERMAQISDKLKKTVAKSKVPMSPGGVSFKKTIVTIPNKSKKK